MKVANIKNRNCTFSANGPMWTACFSICNFGNIGSKGYCKGLPIEIVISISGIPFCFDTQHRDIFSSYPPSLQII